VPDRFCRGLQGKESRSEMLDTGAKRRFLTVKDCRIRYLPLTRQLARTDGTTLKLASNYLNRSVFSLATPYKQVGSAERPNCIAEQ